jgi:hypothetical protein
MDSARLLPHFQRIILGRAIRYRKLWPATESEISLKSGLGSRHRTLYAADDYHQDASHTATNHIADQSPDVHPASRLS